MKEEGVKKEGKKKKRKYVGSTNLKNLSEDKLRSEITAMEEKYKKSTKDFLKSYNTSNFINFEGSFEERHWYICVKLLIEKTKK